MAAIMNIQKSQYLRIYLADFDEILYDDILVLHSLPAIHKLRFKKKSKMADGRHFEKA